MEETLQKLIPQPTAEAICYTLLHSLWQGIAAAILAAVIMMLTKNTGTAIRYRLLTAVLILFFASFTYTLIAELGGSPSNVVNISRVDPFGHILKYLYEHAGVIAGLWLMLVMLKLFRLLISLYMLERFKTRQVKAVTTFWAAKLAELSNRIGVSKAVTLLESGIARVPLMIGFLKPVILLPMGLVNHLAPEEVEAILLHELAHIRRNDYLVNFLQHLAETLLFFNPALLWISALIRAERENCCDDLAVGASANKLVYIRAMVHFQEHAITQPMQALAFSGGRRGFLPRIERLVAGVNRSLNRLEVFGVGLLFLFSVLFIAVRPQTRYRSLIKGGTNPKEAEAKKKAEAEASRRTRAHP